MENNKLIAEFMGYEVKHNKCYSPKHNDGTIAPMQFHKSWDWLMPVVEKIRKIPSYDRDQFGTKVILNGRKIKIVSGSYGDKRGHDKTHFNKCFDGTLYQREIEGIYGKSDDNYSPIRITYYAVIEFIKWYNK